MKKKFLTNLGFLLILNVLIKPLYVFGIDRVVQNTVGAEAYGNYFSLFSIALIFQIFLDLGIENFIRKEIARRPDHVSHYLSNIALLKVILVIPYALICILIALPMHLDKKETGILLLILLNQFLASFILFFRANLGGMQLFKTEGIVSVMDRALMILIVGFLLISPFSSNRFDILWFVEAQTVSYVFVLLISFLVVFRKSRLSSFQINLSSLLPIINQLKPYALLVLLMATYYRTDSIFLRILLSDGEQQAGIYVHGFRILDFMSNYALLFPLLLLPIFSKLLHEKGRVDELLKLAFLLLIVPSIAVIIPSVIYRTELFTILYKEQIALSANAFAILVISYFGMCVSYTFGALLTANGNLRELNIMAFVAVLVSICLNVLLVPQYKVLGAAIANAATQLFTIIYHIVLCIRIFRFRINYPLVFRLFVFLLILCLSAFAVHSFNISWLIGSALLFSIGILSAILLGLIPFKGIYKLFVQRDF